MKHRHLKARKKRTWTHLRLEIQQVCEELGIPRKNFSEVNINSWAEIEQNIWSTFSTHLHSSWIWQTLKEEYSAVAIDFDTFEFKTFIPPDEQVWFLLNETVNGKSKFWIYEGTVNGLNKVFRETGGTDEIIIVSKKYEWIFLINHHDIMIGTGEMKKKIDNLKRGGDKA